MRIVVKDQPGEYILVGIVSEEVTPDDLSETQSKGWLDNFKSKTTKTVAVVYCYEMKTMKAKKFLADDIERYG